MTIEQAIARATELGHDMTGQTPSERFGRVIYVCNNGACWCDIDLWLSGAIDGTALVEECEYRGQWQRDQEQEGYKQP